MSEGEWVAAYRMQMPHDRRRPDLAALFETLALHEVRFLVTGSTAVMLHGIELQPGDLDITPALDRDNLERLAHALKAIDARPHPDGPFGDWQIGPDGERHWVEREPAPGEREARASWAPDPDRPETFDHLLDSRHGAIDVVPEVSGTYADLVARTESIHAYGHQLHVAGKEDLLDSLTIPRRRKDASRVHALRSARRSRA